MVLNLLANLSIQPQWPLEARGHYLNIHLFCDFRVPLLDKIKPLFGLKSMLK